MLSFRNYDILQELIDNKIETADALAIKLLQRFNYSVSAMRLTAQSLAEGDDNPFWHSVGISNHISHACPHFTHVHQYASQYYICIYMHESNLKFKFSSLDWRSTGSHDNMDTTVSIHNATKLAHFECIAQLVDQRVGQHQVQAGIRKVEGTTFAKISISKPPVNDGCTVATQAFERLTTADPPRLSD
ncbi:hypothetical protein BHE74_00050822 [Ensete ventricosum]|nr:hypothetical protein GW17_00052702 [Ensete ventricosum]RWW43511.1 hypothetical protein BHE74_00050822 [Ensete ventricosum]